MGDTGNSSSQPPKADHNLVATYADPEHARSAIEALERKGVEAGNITLSGAGADTGAPETGVGQRNADMAATGAVGKRAMGGLVAGVLIGALFGAVAGYLLYEVAEVGPNMAVVVIAGALAFGGIGAYAGGWYGGASALPVNNEAWGETFEGGTGQTSVAVHSGDPSQVDAAAKALAGSSAIKIVRFGRDGETQQLA